MNSSRTRNTRSLPTASNSHMAPVSKQPRVKPKRAASKNPPAPIPEQASASNSSQRRSLRTTTKRNSEPTKSDTMAENSTPSQEDSETTSLSKSHNTRLRNGIHKVKQKIEIKYDSLREESSEKEKEKMILIDACARELAEIDNDSFQRSFFRDANKVFEQLLLPMHFPWNHKAQRTDQVLRVMPCDIDDMLADPVDHDFGNNDNEEDEIQEDRKMICHRSPQDKGVIELRHTRSAKRRHRSITIGHLNSVPHVNDFAFRMYQEVQSRKYHQEDNDSDVSRSLLSIQCNGVSSEASIFRDVPVGTKPLLLPAIQPRDVAKGKRMSVTKAKELSQQLGSYDCRHGLPDVSDDREQSGRRKRVFAGRTRTIWTRREDDQERATSPFAHPKYTSIITGETLPVGSHKRPLPVKVGLKVNGKIVTVDQKITESSADTLELAFNNEEDYQVSHEAVEGHSQPSNDRPIRKRKSSNPKRLVLNLNKKTR